MVRHLVDHGVLARDTPEHQSLHGSAGVGGEGLGDGSGGRIAAARARVTSARRRDGEGGGGGAGEGARRLRRGGSGGEVTGGNGRTWSSRACRAGRGLPWWYGIFKMKIVYYITQRCAVYLFNYFQFSLVIYLRPARRAAPPGGHSARLRAGGREGREGGERGEGRVRARKGDPRANEDRSCDRPGPTRP